LPSLLLKVGNFIVPDDVISTEEEPDPSTKPSPTVILVTVPFPPPPLLVPLAFMVSSVPLLVNDTLVPAFKVRL